MGQYLILISWHMPYPKEFKSQQSGSNFSVATSKALKVWRKENPRKQIKELTIKVIKL